MAFAGGDTITGARLNRLQTAWYYAAGSGTLVGPQTNADVTSATVTFSTTAANATYAAWCVWDVDWTGATTATGTARINVDGVNGSALATWGAEVGTDRGTYSQNYFGTLAASGLHTLKLVASPQTSQTIQGVNCTILVAVTEVA